MLFRNTVINSRRSLQEWKIVASGEQDQLWGEGGQETVFHYIPIVLFAFLNYA